MPPKIVKKPTMEQLMKTWVAAEARRESERLYRATPAGKACFSKSRKKYYEANREKECARSKINYQKKKEGARLAALLKHVESLVEAPKTDVSSE